MTEPRPRIITRPISPFDLEHWRAHPIQWIETFLYDPETEQPFVLLPAERDFLSAAFNFDAEGRLLYQEWVYSAPKKSGKTTLAAITVLTVLILYGGRYPEAVLCANDLEQSVGRVFAQIKRIIECSLLLRDEARVTQDRISIGRAVAQAIPSGYESAAGSQANISCFDELWAFQTERSRRLFDELVPPPTKQVACRLTVTYAGWTGESVLLEELYRRGLAQPQIAPNLYAGDGLLMAWHHEPVAPWQTPRWIEEMRRSLRPHQFARMIENKFTSNEGSFIDMAMWDRVTDLQMGHTLNNPLLPVYLGLDASTKRDSTAIVVATNDKQSREVRLVTHKVFQPSPDQPLNFEDTVERTVLDLAQRFQIKQCLYDPYQMMASAQRLTAKGVKMVEYAQSSPNLTQASQNLYDLIMSQSLRVYPDASIRLAVSRAVASETPRGWRLAKSLQSHKVDVVVALALAAFAAVQNANTPAYDHSYSGFTDEPDTSATAYQRELEQRHRVASQLNGTLTAMINSANAPGGWR